MIVLGIQNFTKDEILEFVNATNNHFFFFGDKTQSLFEKIKDVLPMEKINDMLPPNQKASFYELFNNHKNTAPFAEMLQYIGVDLDKDVIKTTSCRNLELPRFIKYDNFEKQIEGIARILVKTNLLHVGILVPFQKDVLAAHKIMDAKHIKHELYDNIDFTSETPKILTYHNSIGLQFETVILPNVVEVTSEPQRKALYVAITRTYRHLYVLYSGRLPFPLSVVPSNLYKTTEEDEITDL